MVYIVSSASAVWVWLRTEAASTCIQFLETALEAEPEHTLQHTAKDNFESVEKMESTIMTKLPEPNTSSPFLAGEDLIQLGDETPATALEFPSSTGYLRSTWACRMRIL